jgi:hypothetical protein
MRDPLAGACLIDVTGQVKQKKRTSIPSDVAAKAMFVSDRTCCVCRFQGKPVQIHHIDDDPANHDPLNLAVLCLDCHNLTQISGGFHRKLDSDQVTLYRDDWKILVARRRAGDIGALDLKESHVDTDALTSELEILRERRQYLLLAIRYHTIGNKELRDKYAELALEQDSSDDSVIFLRGLQERRDLIPSNVIKREVKRKLRFQDWSQLGRLYNTVGDFKSAVISYCKSVIHDLEQGNVFAAAYYLKEISEEGLSARLFEEAYKRSHDAGDLWWQVRALQELGWDTELHDLLNRNRSTIENSDNILLRQILYSVTGERSKLRQERITEAKETEAVPGVIVRMPKSARRPRKVRHRPTAGRAPAQ